MYKISLNILNAKKWVLEIHDKIINNPGGAYWTNTEHLSLEILAPRKKPR